MLEYLINFPLVFLAGFIDAIAGGGGLISLPAYLFAGLPVQISPIEIMPFLIYPYLMAISAIIFIAFFSLKKFGKKDKGQKQPVNETSEEIVA